MNVSEHSNHTVTSKEKPIMRKPRQECARCGYVTRDESKIINHLKNKHDVIINPRQVTKRRNGNE